LADFLLEIQDITLLQKRKEDKARAAREAASVTVDKPDDAKTALAPEAENEQLGRGAFMPDGDVKLTVDTTSRGAVPEVEAPHDSGGA
jgi:hypothetical protein